MIAAYVLLAAMAAGPVPVEYSFTIWDWGRSYREFDRFQTEVDQCVEHGFTLIELGVGWPACESEEGTYDFSSVDARAKYVEEKGLGLRLRVNLADWPEWFEPEVFHNPDGTPFNHSGGVPSLFNAENRRRQMAFAAAVAKHFQGRGYRYTPGFSVHMEVKFGSWNTYETSAQTAYRQWLAGKYGTVDALNTAWDTAHAAFATIAPPAPADTSGEPELDAAAADWMRFREQALAHWVGEFAATVRAEDPTALISVPLGESYRRQSAAMANLDYWGYSRAADEVVHSYDFFWHGPDGVEHVEPAVAAMTGITQRPVVFEIDGPSLFDLHGYAPAHLLEAATRALDAGAAGIQVTNWSNVDLRKHPFLGIIGDKVAVRRAQGPWTLPPAPPVLYYVSKWTNYTYREPDDWVHGRQFGYWFKLQEAGIPVRIVTDDNLLHERGLRPETILMPFAPVIDEPVRQRLRQLSWGAQLIADVPPGRMTPEGATGRVSGAIEVIEADSFTDDPRPPATLIAETQEGAQVVRVAACQFFTTWDVPTNTRRIVEHIHRAADDGAQIAVFSEMALTGYTKKAAFAETIDWDAVDAGLDAIGAACRERGVYAVVGAPTRDGNQRFCSAVSVGPSGGVIDVYEKIYLAGEAWATPGRRVSLFEAAGAPAATFICHDERYAPLVQLRALRGAALFFYISCESGMDAEDKLDPYRAQLQARAVENGVFIVHANAPGDPTDFRREGTSGGRSRIIAPSGHVIAEAPVFGEAVVIADIDLRHVSKGGLRKALNDGPLALWMREGIKLVEGDDSRVE